MLGWGAPPLMSSGAHSGGTEPRPGRLARPLTPAQCPRGQPCLEGAAHGCRAGAEGSRGRVREGGGERAAVAVSGREGRGGRSQAPGPSQAGPPGPLSLHEIISGSKSM